MDISVIDAKKVTTENGIKIGLDSAPKKIVEFMNLRCPYSKQWFEESKELLVEAVAQGKVQRIIKLFDKEKESLQRGNVMHHYVSWSEPEKALGEIQKIYDTQEDWGHLSLAEVAVFAEEKLGLKEQLNQVLVDQIITEANSANIKFVPTCVVEKAIFDENIQPEELRDVLDLM
ncbi:thioredoxin domain-containing protein [Enterococcus sp. LJL90]